MKPGSVIVDLRPSTAATASSTRPDETVRHQERRDVLGPHEPAVDRSRSTPA